MKTLQISRLGYAAADALEWETARTLAAEMIASSQDRTNRDIDPSTHRHTAYTILGLAQLGQGDVAGAEKSLIDSAKVPGGATCAWMAQTSKLATELLDAGRNYRVDQLLE